LVASVAVGAALVVGAAVVVVRVVIVGVRVRVRVGVRVRVVAAGGFVNQPFLAAIQGEELYHLGGVILPVGVLFHLRHIHIHTYIHTYILMLIQIFINFLF
jgi:hypothetical protein